MELWHPDAIRRPGPASKRRNGTQPWLAQRNSVSGFVPHSAVGPLSALFGVLDSPARVAAWAFSGAKNGTLYQHYPITDVLYTSGNIWAHNHTVAMELEGGPPGNESEPLTGPQRETLIGAIHWVAKQGGWTPRRNGNAPHKTLWEHRELSDTPTACPSGRIPWATILAATPPEQEEDMDYHVVLPGQTLTQVAAQHRMTVQRLAELNGITNVDEVERWQPLRLHSGVPQPPLLRFGDGGGGIDTGQVTAHLHTLRVEGARGDEEARLARSRFGAMREATEALRQTLVGE